MACRKCDKMWEQIENDILANKQPEIDPRQLPLDFDYILGA